jgi:hypothetical protein
MVGPKRYLWLPQMRNYDCPVGLKTNDLNIAQAWYSADSLPISVNSGRYIAMMIEPIVTLKKPIGAGSIRVNKLAIAESTSYS